MTGAQFGVRVELGHLIGLRAAIRRDSFPRLSRAVRDVTEAAHRRWHAIATGREPMPDGKWLVARSGEYGRSILLRQTGDFSAEVFSELPYARAIEEGTPSRDLKRILDTSFKVRLSAKGKRYLIIPFRHGAPNSVMGNNMPVFVHTWWKSRARVSSHTVAEYMRPSGTGAYHPKTRQLIMVPAWKYRWGTKLTAATLKAGGATDQEVRRLQGMYRFRKPGGKPGQHTQFLSFRTMVQGSPGWILPARPGKHPARQVAEQMRPIAEKAFTEAMRNDILDLLG